MELLLALLAVFHKILYSYGLDLFYVLGAAAFLWYLIGRNPKKITEVVMQQPWVQELSAEGEDVAGTVSSVMGWRYNERKPDKLREAVAQMVAGTWKKCALPDRWDGRTAERIVQILLS